MAVKVKAKRRTPRMRIRKTVLGSKHLSKMGRIIAKSIKANIRAGIDPDGLPLPPDLSGDGRPLMETGSLRRSVRGRVRKGVLRVMPDYSKYRYGIFLQRGHGTVEARRYLGFTDKALHAVADANEGEFKTFVEGLGGMAGAIRDDGLSAIVDPLRAIGAAAGAIR